MGVRAGYDPIGVAYLYYMQFYKYVIPSGSNNQTLITEKTTHICGVNAYFRTLNGFNIYKKMGVRVRYDSIGVAYPITYAV